MLAIGFPVMGDFLAINEHTINAAASAHADENYANGSEAIFWYLAFATLEDAREWYDISAVEF